MSWLETFWGSPLVYRLGCGLLNLLWQGALIAMLLAVAMRLLRGRSAGARYLAAWTALLAMAASVPLTAWLTPPPPGTEVVGAAVVPPGVELPADSRTRARAEPDRPDAARSRIQGVPTRGGPPAAASGASLRDPQTASGGQMTSRRPQWIRPLLPWVVCGWVVGTLAIALWRLGGWIALRGLWRVGTSPAVEAVQQMLEGVAKRLQVHRAVQVLESTRIEVPAVIGWLRPVILLPASILAELPAEQLELILAHELAHIRRHDFLLNLMQTAIETLLFYHPAVWWVSGRIRLEREACCDDLAVAGYPPGGGDRLLYARALTRLEELRHEPAGPLAATVGVAADGAPLLPRIRRVLGLPGDDQEIGRTWLGGSVAVLLLIGALVGYGATAAEPQGKLAETDIRPAAASGSSRVERPRYAGEGLVVDDLTGKPVEQIAVQEGVPNAGAESGIMWITAIQSPRGVAGGRFNITHNWVKEGKVRVRIVADGYLPEVAIIDTEDGLLKAPLIMRLRRGEAIRGRVIDHAGKPVAGAKVFLGGPDRHAEIVDGKIEEGLGGKRETTDTDGRFVVHGAAPGEVNRLVVLAPGLHVWMVPVLELGKELSVKLPEPATLVLHYDIPGDVPEGRFRVALKTWDMPDWKGALSSVQNPTAKNQGEVVLKNMTPGVYDVIRMKQLRVADRGTEAFCDRRDVTLQSGKTTTLRFVRKKAFPIEGDVVGLEGTGILGAFVLVRSPKATGDPQSREDWKLPIYDGVTSAQDGKFKTAPIEPGEYLLVAEAYEPEPRGMGVDLIGTGWTLPAYVGKAKVTVPEDGPPPRVRIEMKPRRASPKPPPPSAPAKASAEARGVTPPATRAIRGQPQPGATAWGPASPKGIRLGVVLEPAKPAYRLGDVVEVKLLLQNSGQKEQSFVVPRLGILEKFGMEIDLRDPQGRVIAWDWGGRYSPEVKKLVCGGFAGRLAPGKSRELAKAALLLGGSGAASDVVAKLGVEPGQTFRLRLKLDTYSYARDDQAGPLESNTVEFRVEATGRTAPPSTPPAKASAEATGENPPTNRVVDAEGKPIAGAKIEFCANPAPDDRRAFASTVTNQAGEFAYPDPAPERMRFRFYVFVSAPGFRTAEWVGNEEVYRRERGVRVPDVLRLDRPATVSGTVLGADGKPLAGVALAVNWFTERRTEMNPRRIVSDQQGRFKIDDLPPADILIRCEKGQNDTLKGAGDAQLYICHVRAKDGQQVENVVVDLSQAKCVVEGQVVDYDGSGIANAAVKATFAASARRLPYNAWARTDQAGRFRIGGLPPHEFLVSASTKNHSGEPGQRVKLEMGWTKTLRLPGYLPGHPAPEHNAANPKWGPPVSGLRAAIELQAHRVVSAAGSASAESGASEQRAASPTEPYSLGETVEVGILLHNTGEKLATLVHDFCLATELQVTDDAGKAQTFSYKGFLGDTVRTTYVLEPGQEVGIQGSFRLKLVGTDFTEHLVRSPGMPLAFPLKCHPGANYTFSCDLGNGLRTGEASLVVKE